MHSRQRSTKNNFGLRISDCGLRFWLCVLCGLCGNCYSSQSANAVSQEVVPVEGPALQRELVSIADSRANFRVAAANGKPGENRALALDQLVRWGNPVATKAQPMVVLADGGQIVAA